MEDPEELMIKDDAETREFLSLVRMMDSGLECEVCSKRIETRDALSNIICICCAKRLCILCWTPRPFGIPNIEFRRKFKHPNPVSISEDLCYPCAERLKADANKA
jgi:hypothetical protein